MTTARAKCVEDLYQQAIGLMLLRPALGPSVENKPWESDIYSAAAKIAEQLRQLHISLIAEENDKAKMPNIRLDGDSSTPVARDPKNDPLRYVSDQEFEKFYASYWMTGGNPVMILRAALNKLLESRRHG